MGLQALMWWICQTFFCIQTYLTSLYFAIDNCLFAVALLDNSPYDQFHPIGTNCRHIHWFARALTSQLVAYCSTEYVHYDAEYQYWLSEHSYANSGVPYLCPNETYTVNAI